MAETDPDRRILDLCLAQDPGGWREFVERFTGLIVHVIQHTAQCRSVPLTSDDLEDLCSEVFLVILANNMAVLRHYRGEAQLSTYLAIIARRVAVKELTRRRMAEALGHVAVHHDALEQAGAEHERIDNQEIVALMLAGLSEKEAAVIRHYHLEGRTYAEISTRVGVPENSIGPLLARAREKLRRSGQPAT
ncbi:MAG TPA: sigma-70 family RNA polymerase sigma factor [Planctomycetaceae bacterium]|nr:sigma-70 family RNA polymerase sigma factor [Planctomycetaceae bacterium]